MNKCLFFGQIFHHLRSRYHRRTDLSRLCGRRGAARNQPPPARRTTRPRTTNPNSRRGVRASRRQAQKGSEGHQGSRQITGGPASQKRSEGVSGRVSHGQGVPGTVREWSMVEWYGRGSTVYYLVTRRGRGGTSAVWARGRGGVSAVWAGLVPRGRDRDLRGAGGGSGVLQYCFWNDWRHQSFQRQYCKPLRGLVSWEWEDHGM